jgi:hypothetical protein
MPVVPDDPLPGLSKYTMAFIILYPIVASCLITYFYGPDIIPKMDAFRTCLYIWGEYVKLINYFWHHEIVRVVWMFLSIPMIFIMAIVYVGESIVVFHVFVVDRSR